MRALLLPLVLAGCLNLGDRPSLGERFDQAGHFAQGYAMAKELARFGDPYDAVAIVMDFARAREELQHPGRCGPGCELDLDNWRRGAEAGAGIQTP